MRFDQRLANGETETAELGPFALLECVENFRQGLGVDAHTGVGDCHAQLAVAVLSPDFETAAFRRKFHRILDQVPKNLLKPRRIGLERRLLCGELYYERQVLFVDVRLANFQRAAQKQMRVYLVQVQLNLAFADSRQVEEIIDEPRFQLDVAPDHLERGAQLIRQIVG